MENSDFTTEKFIVLILNWTGNGGHWIKGFSSLKAARIALREKIDDHRNLCNNALIIRGNIEQIGA